MSRQDLDSFRQFFRQATGGCDPYSYQERFALGDELPELLRVPTGAGKTATVVLGWLWRRRNSPLSMPRRLVYCLPMRTLVEQCVDAAKLWLKNLSLDAQPGIHVLMGGESMEDWHLYPEREVILFGTQDMLLSRALNRGYGASRFRWPFEFGLLHSDCFWVFDEPQLMGAGVATSAQLAGLRETLGTGRPSRSLWMSATLEPDWLATVDFPRASSLAIQDLRDEDLGTPSDQVTPLGRRMFATKRLTQAGNVSASDSKEFAKLVRRAHHAASQTLVVVNTVKRARQLYQELAKSRDSSTSLLLLHSRFRPHERDLQRKKLVDSTEVDRIVIATQVVEAGVDISAKTLITELAPWASLVQRMGRCNRTGDDEDAIIHWVDLSSEREAAPYESGELDFARELLVRLEGRDLSPRYLEEFKRSAEIVLPCRRTNILRRKDLLDLFDTTPDLTGADVDVQRFIRDESVDLDVLVFWRTGCEGRRPDQQAPRREELCPAPKQELAEFLKPKGGRTKLAFVFDHLDGEWRAVDPSALRPGMCVMLAAEEGGYAESGWDAASGTIVPVIPPTPEPGAQNDTELDNAVSEPESIESDCKSEHTSKPLSIAAHTDHVCQELERILESLKFDDQFAAALRYAARWHDLGKSHAVFQKAIRTTNPSLDVKQVWAKSGRAKMARYERPFFRHELASALVARQQFATPLATYLIASHHGKVRASLRSFPGEQCESGQSPSVCGVAEGDRLPAVDLGGGVHSAEDQIRLTPVELGGGDSWTEMVIELLDQFGPFRLAYFEALLRSADSRASAAEQSGVEEPSRE